MAGRATKPIRTALAAGALLGLAGCAVLQIDVDVYKGPLANHEDVQIQQFAAMAIGAKPLLIALRDRLQWPKEKVRNCARGRDKTWYDGGYMAEPKFVKWDSDKKSCVFHDAVPWEETAGRVNAVLSLYEDQSLLGLEPYIKAGNEAVERYRDAIDVFSDKARNQKAWDTVREGFADFTLDELKTRFGISGDLSKDDLKRITDALEVLKLGHRRVFGLKFDPKGRGFEGKNKSTADDISREYGSDAVYLAYMNFLDAIKGSASSEIFRDLGKGLIDNELTKIQRSRGFRKYSRGANHRYETLRKPDVLDVHVDLLFDESRGKEAKLFRQKVVGFADAFFDARQALRDLWLTSLEALTFAAGSPDFDDPAGVSVKFSYAKMISFLTQHRHLDQALYAESAPSSVKEDFKALLNGLSSVWEKDLDLGPDDEFRYGPTRESLEKALKSKPREVVSWLEKADSWFIEIAETDFEIQRRKPEDLKYEVKRKYGLVRGPSFKISDLTKFMEDWDRVTSATSAVGFDRGRLPEGIETLIEAYLKATARDPLAGVEDKKTIQRERAKVRLREALVRFSKKVLFIANNDKLLSENPEDIDRYVLVLQAVGNSIIIQANELSFREDHDRKLKGRLTAEIKAVERVLGRPPETMIGDVLTGIDADLTRAGKRLPAEKAAVTRTGAEQVDATTRKTDAEAKRDDAVVQQARAKSALDTGHDDVAPVWAASRVMKSELGDQLRAAAGTAGAATLDKMFAKIAEKIAELAGQERGNAFGGVADQIDTSNLDLAKTYFESKRKATAADLAVIEKRILTDVELAQKKILRLESALVKKAAKRRKEEEKLRAAKRSLDSAVKAATEAATRLAATQALIPKLENAVEMIEAHRVSAVEDIRKSNVDLKPSEVYARLIDWLDDKHDEPNNTQASKLADAIEVLENRGPPSDPLLLDGVWLAEEGEGWDPKHPNARDVLDTLIAALRHEHIEAVKETGPERGRAPRIAAALKVAYEQRAGMAYIRPSAAYLRSSYPATSLQDNPGLAWRNMLAGHALRSVPFVGEALVNPSSEAETRKIVNEIDKQFWQTINRVRVAGAGDTNYVIAKDDIGNWYVKAFSADPDKIIKSVQKLALFNLGAQLDTNLLSRLDAKDGEAPEDVSKPSLQRLFEEFEKDYAERTGKDFAALKASIEEAGLETSIQTAWSGIDDVDPYFKRADIESNLSTQFDTLQEIEFTETVVAEQSAKILATATAILRFHGALARAIRGHRFAVDPTTDLKDSERQLAEKNGALKTEEDKLTQKKTERDTANDIVQEKLRATELDREGFDEAQKNLKKKEGEVKAQENEVNTKKSSVRDAEAAVATARGNLKKVQDAERVALAALQRVVRDELTKLTASRNQTVKTFETGVLFIGKATKPADKP